MVIRAFHRLDPPRAPILREITEAMGWKSVSAVHQYVAELEEAGYVHRTKGRMGVQVTPEPPSPDDPPPPAPNPE